MMIYKRFYILFTASTFTTLFMLVGWRTSVPFQFVDLINYKEGFERKWYVYNTLNLDPIRFILSEGVWIKLFDWLYHYAGDIDLAFSIVSFITVLLCSIYVLYKTNSIIYLVFFINPSFIDLCIGQIRSGLATGLFYIAIITRNPILKYSILLFSMTIHTAFFLIGLFYIVFILLKKYNIINAFGGSAVKSYFYIFIFATLLVTFQVTILSFLGDRRAYYYFDQNSGLYLTIAFMTFILSNFIMNNKSNMIFESYFYAICVFTMFSSLLFGIYGARFAAIAIPTLAVIAKDIPGNRRGFFIIQYAAFSAAYFSLWLR